MTHDRPPVFVPANSQYVLDVIRDNHRQQHRFDPAADPDAELTFETTVADWRDACDLLDWRPLGRALDETWGLGRSDEAWRSVLEPAKERSLRDVCEFIASGGRMPSIEPAGFLGATCLPAGAFLAIRSLLRDAGADASSIAPSTPLDEYARRHGGVFLGPISRLAPGSLPPVTVSTPWYDLCINMACLALLAAFAGSLVMTMAELAGAVLVIAGVVVFLASWIGIRISAPLLPAKVEFGSLRTFRDLACVVAERARQLED